MAAVEDWIGEALVEAAYGSAAKLSAWIRRFELDDEWRAKISRGLPEYGEPGDRVSRDSLRGYCACCGAPILLRILHIDKVCEKKSISRARACLLEECNYCRLPDFPRGLSSPSGEDDNPLWHNLVRLYEDDCAVLNLNAEGGGDEAQEEQEVEGAGGA